MDLHELLGTAVADLPDAPDLVPEAQRIHHRRTAVTKAGAVAAAAALVVGAGTLTIASPWSRQAGSVPVAASATAGPGSQVTKAQFAAEVTRILQSDWPYHGQTVSWDPRSGPSGKDYFDYKVTTGSTSFEIRLTFLSVLPVGPSHTGITAVPMTGNITTDVYVQTKPGWQQLIELNNIDFLVFMQAEGKASGELTKDQLARLGQSAVESIYMFAPEAGLFNHSSAGPTISSDPA